MKIREVVYDQMRNFLWQIQYMYYVLCEFNGMIDHMIDHVLSSVLPSVLTCAIYFIAQQ